MPRRKAKSSKLRELPRLRIRCTECESAIVVQITGDDWTRDFWVSGKWVLSAAGVPGADKPIFDGVLQPLCPVCQDKHMDPELLKHCRALFASRYEGKAN